MPTASGRASPNPALLTASMYIGGTAVPTPGIDPGTAVITPRDTRGSTMPDVAAFTEVVYEFPLVKSVAS
ncbi:hypothetical protein GCM10023088_07750 [Actinomadura verrucosospora]